MRRALLVLTATLFLTSTAWASAKCDKHPKGEWLPQAEAKAKINRKDFGLNWNKALEAGGVVVSEDVNIDINLELSKKAPLKAER